MAITQTDINYTSSVLYSNISSLISAYTFLQAGSIGQSVLGKNIPYIKIGIGKKEVFYSASIHANEWITSPLLMKFIEDYCLAYAKNENIGNYSASQLFNNVTLYVVPMINPDGVNLVTGQISMNSSLYSNTKFIADKYPNIPFPSGWKANIEGIDLNLQFPARLE